MNVASKELCQELYELSGWSDVHSAWQIDDKASDEDLKSYGLTRRQPEVGHNTKGESPSFSQIPAYDLGYLLRKLPNRHTWLRFDENEGTWFICNKLHDDEVSADTPEDAACKLAIKLFKQGLMPTTNQGRKEE